MNKNLLLVVFAVLFCSRAFVPLFAEAESPPVNLPAPDLHTRIYDLERKKQSIQGQIESLKPQIMQALKENKLEIGKELSNNVEQLEKSLKDIRVEQDSLIGQFDREFSELSVFQKLMIETGAQYTFFDNDLKINDVVGFRFRIHYRQEAFRRYSNNSFSGTLDSPIREVVSSPFILEYRSSEHKVNGQVRKGQVDTYLTGFGLSGQMLKKTFINLTIMAGFQKYSHTQPGDVGPLFSYSMGVQRYLSDSFGFGLTASEDWVLTKATQLDDKTHSFFNFSTTLFARLKF